MKTGKRFAIAIIFGILSTIALANIGSIYNDKLNGIYRFAKELRAGQIQFAVLGILLMIIIYRYLDVFVKRRSAATIVVSVLFSIFMVIGKSFTYNHNFDFMFHDLTQFFISLVFFVGYLFFFDFAITMLFVAFDKLRSKYGVTFFGLKEQSKNPIVRFSRNHYFVFCVIVISICYLPLVLIDFPGCIPYDGMRMLNMFNGYEPLSNHHPWLVTMFFGSVVKLGSFIAGDTLGVVMLVTIIFIAQVLAYSYVCSSLKRWGAPECAANLTLAFFALVPAFPCFAHCILKDGLFFAFTTVFFVRLVDIALDMIKDGERKKKLNPQEKKIFIKKLIMMSLFGLLMSLSRNNGVYMVFAGMIMLLLYISKKEKKIVVCFAFILVVVNHLLGSTLATALGVEKGPIKEMLSVPFQQTARYVRDFPDDVTKDEREAIDRVLDFAALPELYNPEISDNVKDSYRPDVSKWALKEYMLTWLEMFTKHPGVYIEATVENTYGYIYPFRVNPDLSTYPLYIQEEPTYTFEQKDKRDPDVQFAVSEDVRLVVKSYYGIWENMPVLSLFVYPAAYTWVMILLIAYLLEKKKLRAIPIFTVPVLNFAFCLISPVNGYMRYALPLMAMTPVIIYFTLLSGDKVMQALTKKKEKKES